MKHTILVEIAFVWIGVEWKDGFGMLMFVDFCLENWGGNALVPNFNWLFTAGRKICGSFEIFSLRATSRIFDFLPPPWKGSELFAILFGFIKR